LFGNLKEKALLKFNDEVVTQIKQKVELFKNLKPSQVNDDPFYQQLIISPLWALVKAQSGGTVTALQKFVDVEGKFKNALLDVRNELVMVEGEKVSLHPEFENKVGPTFLEAIKK